jgi:hypothetical protein
VRKWNNGKLKDPTKGQKNPIKRQTKEPITGQTKDPIKRTNKRPYIPGQTNV